MQSFSENYSTLWQLELVKVFKFSGKILGFSKTIELCLYFCMRFCITELILSNYNKISSKKQFCINNASHLNNFDIIYLEGLDNYHCAASRFPIVSFLFLLFMFHSKAQSTSFYGLLSKSFFEECFSRTFIGSFSNNFCFLKFFKFFK